MQEGAIQITKHTASRSVSVCLCLCLCLCLGEFGFTAAEAGGEALDQVLELRKAGVGECGGGRCGCRCDGGGGGFGGGARRGHDDMKEQQEQGEEDRQRWGHAKGVEQACLRVFVGGLG